MGTEQDDVGGDAGGMEVLLVLNGVAPERAGADDKRWGTIELRGRFGPGRLLESLERLGPEDPEPPGIGQVVVRRPARQLEKLLEQLPLDRLGAIGLVGAAGTDRFLNVHTRNVVKR